MCYNQDDPLGRKGERMTKEYLGVLGGMGPMASALFYRMITEKTAAEKDQDHINIVLLSDAQTPDRTAAILSDNFAQWQAAWDSLHQDCETLQNLGCRAICCTCNTAHYYLHQFDDLKIPVISMIRETAKEMGRLHPGETIAVLATDGTIQTGLYQKELERCGVRPYVCTPETQAKVMHLIYDCVKAGLPADRAAWAAVDAEIKAAGCRGALLACTELSVIKAEEHLDDYYTDPMEVMAERAIEFMGKQVK